MKRTLRSDAIHDQVEAGGLMAYGASRSDLFRRAATYVDKIAIYFDCGGLDLYPHEGR